MCLGRVLLISDAMEGLEMDTSTLASPTTFHQLHLFQDSIYLLKGERTPSFFVVHPQQNPGTLRCARSKQDVLVIHATEEPSLLTMLPFQYAEGYMDHSPKPG